MTTMLVAFTALIAASTAGAATVRLPGLGFCRVNSGIKADSADSKCITVAGTTDAFDQCSAWCTERGCDCFSVSADDNGASNINVEIDCPDQGRCVLYFDKRAFGPSSWGDEDYDSRGYVSYAKIDDDGEDNASPAGDKCESQEAQDCGQYCEQCGVACQGGLALDTEACQTATTPVGAWGCTDDDSCGCIKNCIRCSAYLDCADPSEVTAAQTALEPIADFLLNELEFDAATVDTVVQGLAALLAGDVDPTSADFDLGALTKDSAITTALKAAGLNDDQLSSLSASIETVDDSGSAGLLISSMVAVAAVAVAAALL